MIEIIALIFFSKKVRRIAEEKNLKASKWVLRLVLTWFGIEILSIVLFLFITGDDSGILVGSLIGIALAVASAFYTVSQLEKEEGNPDEFEELGHN